MAGKGFIKEHLDIWKLVKIQIQTTKEIQLQFIRGSFRVLVPANVNISQFYAVFMDVYKCLCVCGRGYKVTGEERK